MFKISASPGRGIWALAELLVAHAPACAEVCGVRLRARYATTKAADIVAAYWRAVRQPGAQRVLARYANGVLLARDRYPQWTDEPSAARTWISRDAAHRWLERHMPEVASWASSEPPIVVVVPLLAEQARRGHGMPL
jgi:hypothetical protein